MKLKDWMALQKMGMGGFANPAGSSPIADFIMLQEFMKQQERSEETKARKKEEDKKKKEAPKPVISAHTLAMMVLVGPWVGMSYAIMVYFAFKGLAYLIK